MDHLVYVDSKSKSIDKLLTGKKTLIVRGAMSRKIPYNRVEIGDHLYFTTKKDNGLLRASATVIDVQYFGNLDSEESYAIIEQHQPRLHLNTAQLKRSYGKKYMTLIKLENIESIDNKRLDDSLISDIDSWSLVNDIDSVLL